MRLINFEQNAAAKLGLLNGETVVDLAAVDSRLPGDLKQLLAAGPEAMEAVGSAAANAPAAAHIEVATLNYLPPITDSNKIICLGLNYRDHAIETNSPIPDYPVVFVRHTTTLVGHNQAMLRPRVSEQLDFEAELAFIVGKPGRHVAAADALDHVAGYSCFNDGSVRDYQFKSNQFTMGKDFDASGGFGPVFVSADELPAGGAGLRIQTRLNGETVQDSSTSELIFDVPTTIACLTEVMTLLPGDVVITGTPPGVGAARKPPLWMKGGDVCEIDIEGIGVLRNPIEDEA